MTIRHSCEAAIENIDVALEVRPSFTAGRRFNSERLPFSELEIDRTFVRRIMVSEDCRKIVDAMIGIGHRMEPSVVRTATLQFFAARPNGIIRRGPKQNHPNASKPNASSPGRDMSRPSSWAGLSVLSHEAVCFFLRATSNRTRATMPATSREASCGTPNRNAALPPMNDHAIGTIHSTG